ncbi:MAG: HD domain-containing protein, partial [Anaerolineae bacterium]|nr:HD domain-containing protein [Anaerolineae bacterium]
PVKVDISRYQADDLFGDLRGRDFTMNAMAVDIHRLQALIDPLGGAADLVSRSLRACSPSAFLSDPVRILRAVRFSINLELKIVPDTLSWMRAAVDHLPEVSPERIRDELFRILVSRHPGSSIRIFDKLGILVHTFPEVCQLKGVQQSSPHVLDAWNHTLSVLDRLEDLLEVLSITYEPDRAETLLLGLVVMKLGRYRQQIKEHFTNSLNPDRPQRGLLFLSALYHDIGKPSSQSTDECGKIRFLGHEQLGGRMVRQRGEALRLSSLEIERLVTIVNNHMRPSLLSHEAEPPGRRAVYRFFRDTGAAGVDICLLSLADVLATYGPILPPERWSRHLEVVRMLLEAWWEAKEERIFPTPLINGNELMAELDISPGPLIGDLLEAIQEAQFSHEVTTRQEAISLAEKLVSEEIKKAG